MIDWVIVVVCTLACVALFLNLGIINNSKRIFSELAHTAAVLFNHKISDSEKEAVFQRQTFSLFKLLFFIITALMVSFGVPIAAAIALAKTGISSTSHLLAISLSWQYLLSTTIISVVVLVIIKAKKQTATSSETDNSYSSNEEKLHHIAFNSMSIQKALASLESFIYQSSLSKLTIKQPVFVTALPRAGTTLLLELCSDTDDFVSHSYRDMPFVMTPMLWAKFSKRFQTQQDKVERAHGDGMMVSVDSPEAFEEIIWNYFYLEHYHQHSISPWDKIQKGKPEFELHFSQHIKKMMLLRGDQTHSARYISKNNLNIARTNYIKQMFPDSIILVPFRDPLQHALSLLKQHNNFTEIHARDDFAKQYMEAIGHFDFGDNLKPVNFGRWLKDTDFIDPHDLNFWLAYWLACYQFLLDNSKDKIALLNYEKLCKEPTKGLEKLADFLTIKNKTMFIAQANRISVPRVHPHDQHTIDPELLDEANALFSILAEQSIY